MQPVLRNVMKAVLVLTGTLVFPAISLAQRVEACDSPEAREFDFWIGDWTIEQQILGQDGTWLSFDARTSVSSTLEGCAIIEHWQGTVQFFWEGMDAPEPMSGLSVRAYDPDTDAWYISWMDTRTPRFGGPYVGGFDGSRGEFLREWETEQGKRSGRITFSNITSDSVDWELAISSDEGDSWSTVWIMKMYRTRQ